MPSPNKELLDALLQAGVDPRRHMDQEHAEKMAAWIKIAKSDPNALVVNLVKAEDEKNSLKANCKKAADAAKALEKMLKDLLNGNAAMWRVETVRKNGEQNFAVCSSDRSRVQTFPIHPDIDQDLVKTLESWEYALVRENVVVDVWRDDPFLFTAAQGSVVDFKGYADRDRNLVRVTDSGHEHLVELRGPVSEESLDARTKLVLQRDNPRLAIASLPAERAESPFEVSLDKIATTLDDLACMEPVADQLVMDIMKRIVMPSIRQEYDLKPLRGMLLLSYKPGMGKTAFCRAFARWLETLGNRYDFEVVLYVVPPNATKSMWHGEDARIVREEIFGSIRARRAQARTRPLLQLLVMDEVDSLGRRPEAGDRVVSAAQSDAVQSFLAEMDGMLQDVQWDPPADLLVIGMSNRPDMIDIATKRPGRLGDLIVEMPELDEEGAVKVCMVYARNQQIPYQLNGNAVSGVKLDRVRNQFVRPAVAEVFPTTVLRYATDTQRKFDVTAGELMVGTHYEAAMNKAKNRAADRRLLGTGAPGIRYEDVAESLLAEAATIAASMQADPLMLVRQLQIKVPVAAVEAVPSEQYATHAFVGNGLE